MGWPRFVHLLRPLLATNWSAPAKAGVQIGADVKKPGYVYMMASKRNGTIYIGCTSDLLKRVFEHREGLFGGFTKKYGCRTLVWFEAYDELEDARQRERQMKEWQRAWKIKRIEAMNPEWNDLYPALASDGPRSSAGN